MFTFSFYAELPMQRTLVIGGLATTYPALRQIPKIQ